MSKNNYANRRSPTVSTTIALPTQSTDTSTESSAIKKGDKCLILAAPYMERHKKAKEDLRWMRYIWTVREVKATTATIERGDAKRDVPIACLLPLSSETIEAIRNPRKSESIPQELPPIPITELLNLSGASKIAQEGVVITKDDELFLDLCEWLLSAPKLPSPPFELHPAVTVLDGYLNSLLFEARNAIEWSQGKSKKSPRHRCGSLMKDLEALKGLSERRQE